MPKTSVVLSLWFTGVCAIIMGSLLPGETVSRLEPASVHLNNKVLHFSGYLLVATLPPFTLKRRSSAFACSLVLIPIGVCLEFAQLLIPGRSFEICDMVANAAGVLTALALVYFWRVVRLVSRRILSAFMNTHHISDNVPERYYLGMISEAKAIVQPILNRPAAVPFAAAPARLEWPPAASALLLPAAKSPQPPSPAGHVPPSPAISPDEAKRIGEFTPILNPFESKPEADYAATNASASSCVRAAFARFDRRSAASGVLVLGAAGVYLLCMAVLNI